EDSVSLLRPKLPIAVRPNNTVRETIQIMLTHDVGALLVVSDHVKLVGIFTERDLLTRVAGLYDNYGELPVQDFMTPEPETVTVDDTLAFALHKMDVGGYRHLPILREGRPVGVLSVRDMLRHITRLCKDN